MIGSLDFITGYDISVSILYLFPIVLIAWFEGGVPAALISIFSAITWAVADLASGRIYSHITVSIWNAIMVLGMFLIVAYSVAAVKKLLISEREHAHNDYLTGVTNARYFYEQANMEIIRSARYNRPLTLAYIDIDDFEQVNDTFGHGTGDNLLRAVATTMKATLRSTDSISRLGGGQFAILMPETSQEHAAVAVNKVREQLLETVRKNGWPVAFSMGVATCYNPVCTTDELIKMAGNLMSAARKSGKNMVKFEILGLSSTAS
jgi:diguanylate cyclase (GGDEF)-like protein